MSPGDTLQLFVEHVTHIDCGVLAPGDGLGGRTWLVDATLTGTRDANGMLFDFGPARDLLKREIDARLDHRLLVPLRAPGVTHRNETLRLTTDDGARIDYAGPATGVALLATDRITPDGLAAWLSARIAPWLPANVEGLHLALRDEPITDTSYHYCHGLRHHGGNCQRLGHGHRCRLAIAVDGENRPDYAARWAAQWQGVFIGDRADLVRRAGDGRYHFAYTAPQGRFALALDRNRCVLLDGPPTIENIADHIAGALSRTEPGRVFTVRAYEGVGKGANARRGPV